MTKPRGETFYDESDVIAYLDAEGYPGTKEFLEQYTSSYPYAIGHVISLCPTESGFENDYGHPRVGVGLYKLFGPHIYIRYGW